jgi:hypothetical protein
MKKERGRLRRKQQIALHLMWNEALTALSLLNPYEDVRVPKWMALL